jgi:hypothetical protein
VLALILPWLIQLARHEMKPIDKYGGWRERSSDVRRA